MRRFRIGVMGIYVQRSGKKSFQLVTRTGKKGKSRTIKKGSSEAKELGFSAAMSFEEARERAKKLHAEDWVSRHVAAEENRKAIRKRHTMYRDAFLTDSYVKEFEKDYLPEFKIADAHWNTLQRLIFKIALHPSKWFAQKSLVYKQLEGYRHGYYKKLVRYLNLWGYFVCSKEEKAWKDVPMPDPATQVKLEAKTKFRSTASLPLTFPQLLETKSKFSLKHFNWLYVSLSFGLRPREVDNLLTDKQELWRLVPDQQHGWVLEVFQEKLRERGVPIDKCWKYIPTVLPEQRLAVPLIREGNFKRPYALKLKQVLGLGYTAYAGRKNFVQWLKDAGYDLETCRDWMGHLSVKTTEKSYETRRKVSYRPPVKKP